MPVNQAKLDKLRQGESARIGGKGSARRKKKVVHKSATDDKKLQSSLKKLGVNPIQGIEEVNMIKDDGTVLHFVNPKVQASLTANTIAVTGSCEQKPITDLLPGIFSQLVSAKATDFSKLRRGGGFPGQGNLVDIDEGDDAGDDDIPELVDNFEEVSKQDD